MAVEIVMPHLSDAMEEGTIVQWLVAEGERVAEGAPLVEVETDKATVTYEAEHDGTILSLLAGVGDAVAVGAVIAVIGEPAEAGSAPRDDVASTSTSTSATAAAPLAATANAGDGSGDGDGAGARALAEMAVDGRAARPTASDPDGMVDPSPPGRVRASPLARRVAAERDVDLAGLVGSGPHGRVIRADVERAVATRDSGARIPSVGARVGAVAAGNGAAPDASRGAARGEVTLLQLSRLQQTVARRMAEARATVPDFELRCEVDMSASIALREQLREVTERPPSYNDFIVKAAALALREFPRVNGAYRDGAFERYSRVNVGIAVAADDALVVPTIFDADARSLGEISAVARGLADKVRDGSISPAELSGGTFSVSNLGMHGIDDFSAVINPPQSAILSVGSLKARPLVDEAGAVVARPTIRLALACDHRILYGADGARFLTRIRDLLERPVALML